MPVSHPSVVEIGSQAVDLASVVKWAAEGSVTLVWLRMETDELDSGDRPIEAEYTFRLDTASFEAAMQNYLDSLDVGLGYLMTEDMDYIMTEDLNYIMT